MRVPSRNGNSVARKRTSPKKSSSASGRVKRRHPKYGTSKLETYFEENFLKKLGLDYVYQYEAKDIGRFYDFCVFTKDGGSPVLIEIDGSFWHSDPRLIKEGEMTPIQKRNKRVDALKDKWALLHGIPIIRIWEKDIHENPEGVMENLRNRLHVIDDKIVKKKRRYNRKKVK